MVVEIELASARAVAFFSFGPTVLVSPVAGALVDGWNRKRIMTLTDLAAGLATIAAVGAGQARLCSLMTVF